MYLPILEKTHHNQEYHLESNDFERLCKFCLLPIFIGNFLGYFYFGNNLKMGLTMASFSLLPLLTAIVISRLIIYKKLRKHLINRHYRLKLHTFQDIISDSISGKIISLAFSYEDETDISSKKVIAEYQRDIFTEDEKSRTCEIFSLIKGKTFKTPYGLSIQVLEIEATLINYEITGATIEIVNFSRPRIIWKIF